MERNYYMILCYASNGAVNAVLPELHRLQNQIIIYSILKLNSVKIKMYNQLKRFLSTGSCNHHPLLPPSTMLLNKYPVCNSSVPVCVVVSIIN